MQNTWHQVFGDTGKIAISSILIWHYGGLLLDAKWRFTRSSLVHEVITFVVISGVQMWAMYVVECTYL